MIEIDEAIGRVEHLYLAVTGKPIPQSETPYAPIPADTDPAAHVKNEMERLIAALQSLPQVDAANARAWSPPVSLFESAADVVVCADLPGVTRERVHVTIDHGVLVIEGQRALAAPREGDPRLVSEQPFGPFRRTVLLPTGLDEEKLDAQLKDGVLEVRIPRRGATDPKVPVA